MCPIIRALHSLSSSLVNFLGLGSHIELEVDDIAVENFVVTTLLHVESISFDLSFRASWIEVFKLHDFSADEAALKIGMDDTSSTRCLRTLANSPALNLILTSREVMNKLKSTVADCHNLVDHRGATKLSSGSVSCSLFRRASGGEHLSLKLS